MISVQARDGMVYLSRGIGLDAIKRVVSPKEARTLAGELLQWESLNVTGLFVKFERGQKQELGELYNALHRAADMADGK